LLENGRLPQLRVSVVAGGEGELLGHRVERLAPLLALALTPLLKRHHTQKKEVSAGGR